MATRAKELHYETTLDAAGTFRSGDSSLRPPEGWSAEDLLLAGLMQCSVVSLRYSATRLGLELRDASASARATVTRRETDGRYAIVAVAVEVSATLEPSPDERTRSELVERAEQGCFVGASLTAKPVYTWHLG